MNAKARVLLDALDGLPDGATVVEIGCIRFEREMPSDGWSTVYLAEAAREHGWAFHSIDSDYNAVEMARDVSGATVHHDDGRAWLARFQGPIDGLYLDGSAEPGEAVAQYHAARLAKNPVIVVDDAQPIAEHRHGKADLLIDVLSDDGFDVRVVETEPGYLMAVAHR